MNTQNVLQKVFKKNQLFSIAQFPGKNSLFSSCQSCFLVILFSPQRPSFMISLCITVVTHRAVKLILLNICCLFLWKIKSLVYCFIGHLRSKICFIVTDFSFSGECVTPLRWYHKENSSRCLHDISGKHTPEVLLHWWCPRLFLSYIGEL